MGVNVPALHEGQSMSRVHGHRAVSRFSRRKVLTIAATVGVGATTAGVAGLSVAGERPKAAAGPPLVISLRDARTGTFDVFTGTSKVTLKDAKLLAAVLKAVTLA
jgi:hypothetical protein